MHWWEVAGLALGAIGVLLTVYYGIKAVSSKRTKKQNQKVGRSGIGIQSGRDTTFK